MLRGVMCVLVRAGVGRVRAQVLEARLKELGAHVQEQPAPSTTHVFAAVPFASLSAHLRTPVPVTARFYSLDWLTESLRLGKAMPADQFLLPSSPGWIPAAAKRDAGAVKAEEKAGQKPKLEASWSLSALDDRRAAVKSEVKGEANAEALKNEVKVEALMGSLTAPEERVQLRYEAADDEVEGEADEWDAQWTQLPTQSQDTMRALAFLHTRRLASGSSSSSAEVPRLSPSSLSPHLSPKKASPKASPRKQPPGHATELSPKTSPRTMSPLSPDRDLSQIYTLTQRPESDEEAASGGTDSGSPRKAKAGEAVTTAPVGERKRKELEAYTDVRPWMARKRAIFACQRPSSAPVRPNHNEALTKLLGQLEEAAKSTGDKWRAYSYRKAITVIRNLPRPLRTAEEARQLRGVGESIGEKIAEILATGRLRKAENKDEFTQACEVFSKVWGAGPETLKRWYGAGYRTLEDLRAAPPEALTAQQRVGLRHYHDFLLRIPRAEVTEIEARVAAVARSLAGADVRVVTCGSYRRGRPDCGDVDILLSNRSGSSLHGFLPALVRRLHATGLLTADLSHTDKDEQDKYFGVCRLTPQHPHRRLDFQLIPAHEWPFALLYFTGSDHFNRSMRLWAKKNGMSLSEHALVRRLSEDMKGDPLPNIDTEEEIFAALGLRYIPPEERNV